MRSQLLIFIIAMLVVFTLSRAALSLWQSKRVKNSGNPAKIFTGGLRFDINMICSFAVIPAFFTPWLENSEFFLYVTAWWYSFWFLVSVFMELATPQFVYEYDVRPNRLFVEYLKHPKEVTTMLVRGYKWAIAGTVVGIIIVCLLASWLFFGERQLTPQPLNPIWARVLESLAYVAIAVAGIRGTAGRRPINPATVAFSSDGLVNSLALNSIYSLFYAMYSMKYEVSAGKLYGKLDTEEVNSIVCETAGITPDTTATANSDDPKAATWHHQTPSQRRDKPLNIVIIVEESLGAQYVSTLGGENLTPNLDKLYQEGWGFTNIYATGTRSVRGLEALSAGFPPTVTQSVFKLPAAQQNFFTIAKALGEQHNYHSRFVYGGEAHFDNMKSFFLNNGFKEVIDENNFKDTVFKGTWGYCDEDMFRQLDKKLLEDHQQHRSSLSLAFTVSNHTPWEYPDGRIEPQGNKASVQNTVRYADHCIGEFVKRVKEQPYWDNTVFLIVADHDSRVFGESLIPMRHFQIPAVIFGGTVEKKGLDSRLISQIDLPVTLLSLAGIELSHPMIGQDLTQHSPDRAIMQYDNRYGYLQGDQLLVLEPHLDARQYTLDKSLNLTQNQVDETLRRRALAHALWPYNVYKDGSYH